MLKSSFFLHHSIPSIFSSPCYSRCGLFRSTPSNVSIVWQNLMFVGMDGVFFLIFQTFCFVEVVSCHCPLFIQGAVETNRFNFVDPFSRISVKAGYKYSLSWCSLEEMSELQGLDFRSWCNSRGLVWEYGFRWNELRDFFPCVIPTHSSIQRKDCSFTCPEDNVELIPAPTALLSFCS